MKNLLFKTLMLKGEPGATITNIEKIGGTGSYDILRIYLSDGTHVDFEVTNTVDEDKVKLIIAEQTDDELSNESENAVQNKVINDKVTELEAGIDSKVGAWTLLSKQTKPSLDIITPVDVSSVFDEAREFLVSLFVTTSTAGSYMSEINILIPNVATTDQPGQDPTKRDFINGYYYDANYNGCLYVRYNYTGKIISVISSFSQITGSSDAGGTFSVYYR